MILRTPCNGVRSNFFDGFPGMAVLRALAAQPRLPYFERAEKDV